MNILFFTNARAPYRTLQLETIVKENNISLTTCYVDEKKSGRKWSVEKPKYFNELDLEEKGLLRKFIRIFKVIRNYEIVIIGGHEYIEYIFANILAILHRKKIVFLCDGISAERLKKDDINSIKKIIKKLLFKNTSAIFGNGEVSKIYFNKYYNYSPKRIFNQYLTVDIKKIKDLSSEKDSIRYDLRRQYLLSDKENVLCYCGRLIDIKNIKIVIDALSILNSSGSEITLFIIGGGDNVSEYREYAENKNVKLIFSGYLNSSELIYKHYFLADYFILPSVSESWGLVVNEAAAAGLPILCSTHVGASLDLIKNGVNGYLFSPYQINELVESLRKILCDNNITEMGQQSQMIISDWTFNNSAKSFKRMLEEINK